MQFINQQHPIDTISLAGRCEYMYYLSQVVATYTTDGPAAAAVVRARTRVCVCAAAQASVFTCECMCRACRPPCTCATPFLTEGVLHKQTKHVRVDAPHSLLRGVHTCWHCSCTCACAQACIAAAQVLALQLFVHVYICMRTAAVHVHAHMLALQLHQVHAHMLALSSWLGLCVVWVLGVGSGGHTAAAAQAASVGK